MHHAEVLERSSVFTIDIAQHPLPFSSIIDIVKLTSNAGTTQPIFITLYFIHPLFHMFDDKSQYLPFVSEKGLVVECRTP